MYEEVLNNHITNESDVIKVAIEQYQEKQMKTRAIDAKPDDYLSITQVVDENGSEQDIISTGLLIVDEHQQRVAITDIVSNTGQLSQYSIYATMKVSVTNDRQALKVRINWFETTLNYGTSMKASSLMQTSKYSPEVGFQYDDITKTISNPAGGTPYHYTPNNTQIHMEGMSQAKKKSPTIKKILMTQTSLFLYVKKTSNKVVYALFRSLFPFTRLPFLLLSKRSIKEKVAYVKFLLS